MPCAELTASELAACWSEKDYKDKRGAPAARLRNAPPAGRQTRCDAHFLRMSLTLGLSMAAKNAIRGAGRVSPPRVSRCCGAGRVRRCRGAGPGAALPRTIVADQSSGAEVASRVPTYAVAVKPEPGATMM